ncbi:MAG TPA: ferritin-like domain-containing protein [Anaeromyxobacteraceae bacterium]|nr:ferritin-like domain-containing protein [Anaeromyxobacteraceae bacterium]
MQATRTVALGPDEFLAELDGQLQSALAKIGEAAKAPPSGEITIRDLLMVALRNEIEASEEAAMWLVGERDAELKLGLARQCGDEARHYRLIADRLRELGADLTSFDPLSRGASPMFRYLKSLETPAERIAAGPYAREGLAIVRNQVFAEFCDARGDAETARLYREVIGPDEQYHHELGRRMLRRYAVVPEDQEKARRAVARTLQLAEEIQETARLRQGISSAPGC